MRNTLIQRPLAQADAAHPIDRVLSRAPVRPLIANRSRPGRLRHAISMIAVAILIVLTLHVAMADPLGRAFSDIERAATEYCGQC